MKRLLALVPLVTLAACGDRSGLPSARSLSAEGANHRVAGYSPDGSRLYWWQQEEEDGQWHLYASAPDMRSPERLPLSSPAAGNAPLAFSPDGTRFAIAANPGGGFPSAWLMEATGGGPRRLTPEDVFALPLQWHPDGRRLLYVTVVEGTLRMMVLDVESGTHRRLLPSESRPHFATWSPDATRLAVEVIDQGRNTIWLADGDGGNLREVTTEGFEQLEGGVSPWSPDGSSLLYTSRRTGTSDIWVLPADGSDPRRLTSDVRDDNAAVWSPDGRWVAFQSNRGLQDDLWVVPAAGGEAIRVTDDMETEQLVGWRPRGTELAYTVSRRSRRLWTHTLAGDVERQITPDSLDVSAFNVSSAGMVSLHVERGGGVVDIASLPLSGGAPRLLLRDAQLTEFARWSADGSLLAFSSTRAGANPDVWVMDSVGGGLRQVTNWPESEHSPVFDATGASIVFSSDHAATFGDLWRVPVSGGEPTRLTNVGTILGTCWQRDRLDEVLVVTLADAPVTIAAMRLLPGGRLQTLGDRTTGDCGSVSPTSDSVAIQTMLVPLSGGPGRRLLEQGQHTGLWSPDGRRLAFTYTADPPFDLGILDLVDGSTRRITNTPESETGTEWSPDGSALVFLRVVPVNRITTVDVGRLIR